MRTRWNESCIAALLLAVAGEMMMNLSNFLYGLVQSASSHNNCVYVPQFLAIHLIL